MANFSLDINVLNSTIAKMGNFITSITGAGSSFAQTNENLTITGWTGKGANVFSMKSGKFSTDWAKFVSNETALKTSLKSGAQQAEVIVKQLNSIAAVFGASAKSATKIGYNPNAKAAAVQGCMSVKSKFSDDLSDLEQIMSLGGRLQISKFNAYSKAISIYTLIENKQTKLVKLASALDTYEADVFRLTTIMKGWKPVPLPVWQNFVTTYFTHTGMGENEALALWGDANAINVLLAVMLGVNYKTQYGGDPVNMSTGNFVYQKEYLKVAGYFPLSFLMTYNSTETRTGALGPGWTHSFEISIERQDDKAIILLEDGQREVFEYRGSWRHAQGEDASLTENDGQFTYRTHQGVEYLFDNQGKLIQITDRNGHFLKLSYNDSGQLQTAENDSGAQFNFSYEEGRLVQVADNASRAISLTYSDGILASVTGETGAVYSYAHNDAGRITQVTNPLGIAAVENEYDENGRVIAQSLAGGGKLSFVFDDDAQSVKFTEQNGNEVTHIHDNRYRSIKTIYSDGTETSEYDNHNHLTSFTDKLDNTVSYGYDERGNRTSITNALGEETTTTYNELNRPTEVAVCGVPQLKAIYDERGNAIETSDGLGRTIKTKRNEAGQPEKITLSDESEITLAFDERGNITSATDPSGTATCEYDELNRPVLVTDPLGNEMHFVRDARGNTTQATNAAGDVCACEYNGLDRPTKIIDFDGSTAKYGYHKNGRPESFTDQEGNTTTLEYDLMGNPIRRTDAEGFSTQTEYDQFNRPIKVIDEEGITVEQYVYDALGNKTKITGPRGEETSIVYDALSRPIEVTEPDGAKLSAIYNVLGKPTCITDALGHKYLREYDIVGQLIKATDPTGTIFTFSYSLLGKLASITNPAGLTTTFDYLLGGLLEKITYPDGRYKTFTYDAAKNLTSQTDQDGFSLYYTYDCLNRIIEISTSTGQKTTYSYDAVGRVISATDTLGNTTCFAWSPTGRLIKVTDPLGACVQYTYDKRGLISEVKQLADLFEAQKINAQNTEVRLTTYKRTPQGRISDITDALGATEAYTYNVAGQPVTKLDKDGYLTNYDYDIVGQLSQVDYADGKSVELTHNVLRQLTAIEDWIGTTTIDVDEIGRATKVTDPAGKEVSYGFGLAGQRTSITYPGGREVAYGYDEFLRLSSLTDGETQVGYSYDQSSRLIEKLFSNGTAAKYAYNEAGIQSELIHTDTQGVLDSYAWSFDRLLRKSGAQVFRRDMPEATGDYTYGYDALSHLTEVTKDGKLQKTFGYDPFGNRSFMQEPSGRTDYAYNALNQLLHSESSEATKDFSYDKRGNLIQALTGGQLTHAYEYGAFNRLMSATDATGKAASYLYNGLEQRVGEKIEDGLNPTRQIDYLLDLTQHFNNVLQIDDGIQTKDYLWDGMIAAEASTEGARTYLPDDLGSPLRFMGADGLPQDSYFYDEFGVDLSANQDAMQPFGFTGYRFDSIADTYFAQARQYDPAAGRFVGADPHWNTINMIFGDSGYLLPEADAIKQSSNLYAYCMNDPLQLVDVLGAWGGDVHSGFDNNGKQLSYGTYAWTLDIIAPNSAPTFAQEAIATSIATADKYIDDPFGGANAVPIIGKPYLHFNTTATYYAGGDTRLAAAGNDYQSFLANAPKITQQYTSALNTVSPYSCHQNIVTINTEYNTQLYSDIGAGLHSLQDIFAHGNKGIAGVDKGNPIDDFDSVLAYAGITSHIFNNNNHFDDRAYDWADCSLTKVKYTGVANSTRYKSTELASEGYIASALYEAGKS
ncbi:MAG: DUF6531 domain-containing protein [Coriobacteriia bacterium]|nr:DUF6531 domain-containing protein [Coriobacteriia bacterium]